ncbi:DNA gyrase inhibitor YacG [Piscinibacter sakaiensis]|uniref:DNA gyrase inhibitor YacG n=1 Tax=Piscinibacter sakaiensis TaxID=1547922 RepID=A0A0K8NWT6_PISS1|nr:DNA gyrase inhibitor YacG [Piscinibacter sakaiensis]GAP34846.1 zinc-binding protein [Piscinibacter sakaiensis]
MTRSPTDALHPREVRCPGCGQPARYAADNPWRPFCSARCKGSDLGDWAAERFRLSGSPAGPGGAPADDDTAT